MEQPFPTITRSRQNSSRSSSAGWLIFEPEARDPYASRTLPFPRRASKLRVPRKGTGIDNTMVVSHGYASFARAGEEDSASSNAKLFSEYRGMLSEKLIAGAVGRVPGCQVRVRSECFTPIILTSANWRILFGCVEGCSASVK